MPDMSESAAIRREFPAWNPFRSDAGRWWASRIKGRKRLPAGAAMTVDADTPDKLRDVIREQEGLAGTG